VKRQVAAQWHPEEAYRARVSPTGPDAALPRYTELRIVLAMDGSLQDVELLKTSGLEFLDTEAISAFRAAAPFADPPRELLDPDRLMRFHFGFLLDPHGPPMLRWFRYVGDGGTSVDSETEQRRDGGPK
jgi:TonB family protein